MNIIRYIICFLLIQSHGLFSQDYSSIRKKTRLAIFSILDKTNQTYSDGSGLNLDKRLYDKLVDEDQIEISKKYTNDFDEFYKFLNDMRTIMHYEKSSQFVNRKLVETENTRNTAP